MTLRLGSIFKIGHFSHLNPVEREKVTLRCIIRFIIQYNEKGQARLCSTIFYKPNIRENVASWVGVEKTQFVIHQKKNSDYPDIARIKDVKIHKF